MKTITATKITPEIFNQIEASGEAIAVKFQGKKYVITSQEDYAGRKETDYLLSSKKNTQRLKEALAEPLSAGNKLEDYLAKTKKKANSK